MFFHIGDGFFTTGNRVNAIAQLGQYAADDLSLALLVINRQNAFPCPMYSFGARASFLGEIFSLVTGK